MNAATIRLTVCSFACAALIALAGCASGASSTGSQSASGSESGAASASAAAASSASADSSAESTQIANPWNNSEDAALAAKGAGIDGFVIPDAVNLSVGDVAVQQFRYMEGIAEADASLLEADGTTVDARVIIRKGTAVESGDISGDYNEYGHQWTQDIDGINVTCFGKEDNAARKIIWSNGDYLFSIMVDPHDATALVGLAPNDVEALVKAVQ